MATFVYEGVNTPSGGSNDDRSLPTLDEAIFLAPEDDDRAVDRQLDHPAPQQYRQISARHIYFYSVDRVSLWVNTKPRPGVLSPSVLELFPQSLPFKLLMMVARYRHGNQTAFYVKPSGAQSMYLSIRRQMNKAGGGWVDEWTMETSLLSHTIDNASQCYPEGRNAKDCSFSEFVFRLFAH